MKKSMVFGLIVTTYFIVGCNNPMVTVEDIGNGKCKATYKGRETVATCADIEEYAQFLEDHDGAVISHE